MSEEKKAGKIDDILQDEKARDEAQMMFWRKLMGKLHEGISQLSGEAQEIMLRKHAEASVDILMDVLAHISGRDPKTFDVDEMMKNHEMIEKGFADGEARMNISRQDDVITWRTTQCYDPKLQQKIIKPYPAYCRQCNEYFFKGVYQIAHKGPVKIEGSKSILQGDNECLTRIVLL